MNEILASYGLIASISQVPVVLVPIDFDQADGVSTKRSIAIRTFLTSDFMTGVPAVPGQQVEYIHR